MASSPLTATTRQRYDVPAALVFDAFTEPALLTRWFSPSADVSVEILVHELRRRGHYRFRYSQPSGEVSIVTGEFCEISPPTRLIFTWTWEPPDRHAGIETLVTVDFIADGTGTRVVVTHERFPDRESRDRHEIGWRATLARMVTR